MTITDDSMSHPTSDASLVGKASTLRGTASTSTAADNSNNNNKMARSESARFAAGQQKPSTLPTPTFSLPRVQHIFIERLSASVWTQNY